ncbi:MAG: hypothetical protein HYY61_00550 [Deltaproteobacteria bacterium]|nr:hypothetical protein [Deltaproteobacteria bacterium]
MPQRIFRYTLIAFLAFLGGFFYSQTQEYSLRKPASYGVLNNYVQLEVYESQEASYYTVSWKIKNEEPVHIQVPAEQAVKAFLLYQFVKNGELDFYSKESDRAIKSYRFSNPIRRR